MINKVYERDFESLLQNIRDIRSHHKNIQSLMTEVFKIKNELAPPVMDSPIMLCLTGEMNLITSVIFKDF